MREAEKCTSSSIWLRVLFLGNWRAGLVVASVIPLSMLFAFGMMKAFGIDGNLMSLGAIDFGMIVDSAVIIVEAVVTHINTGHFSNPNVRAAYLAQSGGNAEQSHGSRYHILALP